MKRLLALVVGICLVATGANAWWQSVQQVGVSGAAPTYQGPGDVVSGATAMYSCSRTYTAALATTSTSLCDLVAVTGGAAVCTLRGSSTGLVDLAASYCAGTTPLAACAAASGGSCKVAKMYNQANPGTNDATNATLTNMPALTFSATNGLPSPSYSGGASQVLTSTSTIAQVQPYTMSTVYNRTAVSSGGYMSFPIAGNVEIRGSSSANALAFSCGIGNSQPANDNVFHAVTGTCSSGASAINVDGVEATGISNGSTDTSGPLQLGKSTAAAFATAFITEIIFYPASLTATQRGALSTNQRSVANGYNF